MFVAKDDDLGAAGYCVVIFASGGGGMACACLGKDDFAHAVAVADCITDVGEDAGHLGLFGGENLLMGKKQLEERHPMDRGSSEAAEYGQKHDQRRDKDAEVMQ